MEYYITKMKIMPEKNHLLTETNVHKHEELFYCLLSVFSCFPNSFTMMLCYFYNEKKREESIKNKVKGRKKLSCIS